MTITVTDVNETPVVTGEYHSRVRREWSRAQLQTYDDNDPEQGSSITWSLSGHDADDMDISGGDLYVQQPAEPRGARRLTT